MDDNKKSTTIWLRPSVISRMDGWLEADNCQSRSEFVDKALRFYMGYLGTEDNTTYISQAILTAIQGTLELNNLRLQTILFKCAVELNMLCHTIAAHFRADPIHTRELRAYAVDEVKRTNGQVSFENAVRSQRRINDGIGVFLIQRIDAFSIKHFVPPFRSEWVKRSERRAAGSGSLRRRSAGNDKKRPHRHKSLHGRFGAVQYGNCRWLPEGIGILRYPGIARLCSRRGSSPQH